MKLITTKNDAYLIFETFNEKFGVDYNEPNTAIPSIYVDITFDKYNWTKEYSEQSRTYRVTNRSGKRFFNLPSSSRSVYGDCLDGADYNVRLDVYDWSVEKCVLTIPEEVLEKIMFRNNQTIKTELIDADVNYKERLIRDLIIGFYDVKDGEQK